MHSIGDLLLGAGLVAMGVLASALADRIRGIRQPRHIYASLASGRSVSTVRSAADPPRITKRVGLLRVPATKPERTRDHQAESKAQDGGADEVIAALVVAGYKKAVATEAVQGCSAAERTTLENWTRASLAALRRCA